MFLFIVSICVILFFCIFIYLFIQSFFKKNKKTMMDNFKSLSYDITSQSNRSFLDLAKATFDKYQEKMTLDVESKQKQLELTLNPLKETLEKLDGYTKQIEKQRSASFAELNKQIESLIDSENHLRKETHNLASSLKSPNIKGAWGQLHLKRILELTGLVNNCDFYEQKSQSFDDKVYRPDFVINLPNDRQIIIDAKTPFDLFLESQDANETIKQEKLKQHTQKLRLHIKDLASKEYFSKFAKSLEYVILFLPAESLLSSAIQIDPTILEMAARKNVILATPTTLIAILKAIAYSWKQETISKNASEIAKLGSELYDRLNILTTHFSKVGKNLSAAVDGYNQAISSFNSRVLVSAKKLKEMAGIKKDETILSEINKTCTNAIESNIK
ncbi:MAG: DNA recombination protein RmuC [Candidatus Anoxychlamydiales bacterium]|nr:DNA recombination protein RmuC [Candidatus Anoxychlamydiales bacterium]